MARLRRRITIKYCIACGHEMSPYMIICDRCGSIQRPIGGDGLPIPPEQLKPCEFCMRPIPIEDKLCPDCEAANRQETERPVGRPVVQRKGVKIAAATAGTVSLGGIGACTWALVSFQGVVLFTLLLTLSIVVFVVSTSSFFMVWRVHKVDTSEVVHYKGGEVIRYREEKIRE